MKPAIALLTCDRLAYTEKTLQTLAEHNDLKRFTLLHGDDGSTEVDVFGLVKRYGFRTVSMSPVKQGWRVSRLALFEQAAKRADWILFLENDIEWARPFPWALFDLVQQDARIYCLRLQGVYKDREQLDAHMVHHKDSIRDKPVKWKPIKKAPEPAQIGRIHWSAQPSVTRATDLLRLHRHGLQSKGLTARVLDNVTFHIGGSRTPRVEAEWSKAQRRAAWARDVETVQ